MLTEPRRRAYLDAMQIVQWLPRAELPFAAPSRPELFIEPEPEPEVQLEPAIASIARPAVATPGVDTPGVNTPGVVTPRPKVAKPEIPRPAPAQPKAKAEEPAKASEPATAPVPPPRFALQLLRAGRCLLLVELPTGEAFQSRDPAYLLLKDMLRAAGLPDSPKMVGDPVRWPLLTRGNLDQGPQAATDFVQGFVAAQTEREPCTCLWLVGLPALRFGGASDADGYQRHWQVEGLGDAWGVPGLESLMEEPQRKAAVWQSMRALMPRWITPE